MKQLLLVFGIAASAVPAIAQHYEHDVYDKSVFSDYRNIQPVNKNAMMVTSEKVHSVFPGWNASIDKLNNNFIDIYGDALTVKGSTIADKAQYLMANKLNGLAVNAAEWRQTRNEKAPHASYVDFEQYINGRQVIFSRLSFRFTTNDKLVRVKMNNYGQPKISAPAKDRANMLRTTALTDDIKNVSNAAIDVANDWVWFPVPSSEGYEVKQAWAFVVKGTTSDNFPVELKGYIDGVTGELLYRTNEVKEIFNVNVKANVYKTSDQVASLEPLSNLVMTIGANNFYTNDTGLVTTGGSINPPQTPTLKIEGRWASVRTSGGGVPSFSPTITSNGTTYTFPSTSPSSIRHLNAYYHVNVIHDFMKGYFGTTFTDMDVALTTNIDVAGSCNAFYNGSSINFYAAGGTCNSFANVPDIVYHEYGHGISGRFYPSNLNGALNEGNSDVWAFSITRDSILGKNAHTNGGGIRTYGATKIYPQDIQGEVHADGEIIAGSWFDVARNTNSFDTMTKIFALTYYDLPNGPTGTEGQIYHDVLISAILNDDHDGILSNGTNNMAAIVSAFAKHGIYLLSDATLNHTELAHQTAGQPIAISAQLALTEAAFFQDLKLFYRVRGAGATWDSVVLTNTGNYNFTGQIPAQNAGSILDYYFAVYDVLSNSTFGFPNGFNRFAVSNQVTIPYQFGVGISQVQKVDFETPATGWTIGDVKYDDATSGKWIQAKPIASSYNSMPVQVGADHTTGSGSCLVTGNGLNIGSDRNSADVDNGKTSIESAVLDLRGFTYPIFEYYRWYSNDRGTNARSDAWIAQVRDPSSALWKNVDITYQSDYSWRRRIFAVQDYWPNSKYVQIKFIATDAVNNSLPSTGQNTIEAAVDDFAIYDLWATGVDGVQADMKAKIYPNPADNSINITLPTGIIGSLSLYDMAGRAVAAEQLDGNTNHYMINTSQLPGGTYLLMIQGNKLIQSQKVVISH